MSTPNWSIFLKAPSKPPLRPLRLLNEANNTDPLPSGHDGKAPVTATMGISAP
jgi:hypothetical protein